MYQDKAIENFQLLLIKIGPENWKQFLLKVRERSDKTDHKQIFLDSFLDVLSQHNL
jgi:hypothetical protein